MLFSKFYLYQVIQIYKLKVKSCPFIEVKFYNFPFKPSLVLLNDIVASSTGMILVVNVFCSLHFLGFVQCIKFNELKCLSSFHLRFCCSFH